MARIHPTAVVDRGAKLADDVEIGPYAVVDGDVCLARGVEIGPHTTVTGRTSIGEGTRVYPSAVIGTDPQIAGPLGRGTRLVIGRDNVIREFVTIHVGSERGTGATRIGDGNFFLNNVHIAHDVQIGSHCTLASFTALGGHVVVEDHVVSGAMTGVHQRARLGESVFTAANSMVPMDALPFCRVAGDRARFAGLNSVGLERRGMASEVRGAIKHAFHILFHSKLRLEPALARVREECAELPEVDRLLRFASASERGLIR